MNEIPEDVEIETIWVVDVPYTPRRRSDGRRCGGRTSPGSRA